MKNYITIHGRQIELSAEQTEQFEMLLNLPKKQLSEVPAGETCMIGGFEFLVLEHNNGTTALILKYMHGKTTKFGENSNYAGSTADKRCNAFAEELMKRIGEENVVEHAVDLTADDGLKDYGVIRRRASLLTADMYRRFVYLLDNHKPMSWWWLATPFSTKAHGDTDAVKCVSPSGYISDFNYCGSVFSGVRPFCVLKSNIFVS